MRPLSSLAVFACTAMLLTTASAQQDRDTPAPPQLEPLEEGEPPAITIRKPGGDDGQQITQTRKGGKVTEVRVSTGGSTYYVKPNDQPGSALPGDVQASLIRAPQWQVLEFDLSRQKKEQEADAQDVAADSPPAAAVNDTPSADGSPTSQSK